MKFKTPTTIVATLTQLARIRRDYRLVMWSLVVMLFPFYVFDSGVPQPADWIAVTLLPILLRTWNGRLRGRCSARSRRWPCSCCTCWS